MKILNALQIADNPLSKDDRISKTLRQPLQFISKHKKDEDWYKDNIDWWEDQGIRQIIRNSKKILRNQRLARGIIDMNDYVPQEDNEYGDYINILIDKENEIPTQLQFFPIIPIVVNILSSEFSSRTSKLTFVANDRIGYNEMLDQKKKMIEETLISIESQKLAELLISRGIDPNSEDFQEQLNPENIKSLPQIQSFINKDFQSTVAIWAQHQKNVDEQKFKMQELETIGFRSFLEIQRELWHFRMLEDDYEVELWEPILSFCNKSPNQLFVSESNVVGNVNFLSTADIIDSYGYIMNEDQLKSLEDESINYHNYNYGMVGNLPENNYDPTKSRAWNMEGSSLAMREYQSFTADFVDNPDLADELFSKENAGDFYIGDKLRVTTLYWKTQRKLFHLTKITENGEFIQRIVDEDFVVVDKPIYDSTISDDISAETLLFGEHLEPLYINEVVGGVKISRGKNTGYRSSMEFNPIYLGINSKKPGRLKYQLKGENSLYGSKIPVEGRFGSTRSHNSTNIVDLMAPNQINFNLVNNQITDILIGEIGPVGMIDQNALPKNSMGDDWGPNNYARAYQSMKMHKLLPLDTSIRNTEGAVNFNNYGLLNLDETNRLAGRINLAVHFKQQALEAVGITPQRMGIIQRDETATGVQAATSGSYTQTEMYFIEHSDWLMPRVHEMRTNIAQYYHAENPSVRLQYLTTNDEKVYFEMETDNLDLRNINVYCTTQVNIRKMMEQMKQLLVTNNQNGASLYDLGSALQADTLAELNVALKNTDQKIQEQQNAQMQHEQQMNDAKIQADKEAEEAERAFDAEQAELNRQRDIQVASIRAAGYPASDVNKDGQDDYLQRLNYLQKEDQFFQKLQLEREKEANKNLQQTQTANLKREELNTRKQIAEKQLQVARENKNKYDTKNKKK